MQVKAHIIKERDEQIGPVNPFPLRRSPLMSQNNCLVLYSQNQIAKGAVWADLGASKGLTKRSCG